MIETIVFDLGVVLIDLDMEICRKTFMNILGYGKINELLDPCHQKGIYSDLEEGRLSPGEFRAEILRESRPGCASSDVDRCMHSFLTGMDPRKADLLRELGTRYRLCVLSNNNPISMARCHEIFDENGVDWRHLFHKEFVSADMKMLKPDPRIYRTMLDELGSGAETVLFVDDSLANVEAASALGIRALHYAAGDDLGKMIFGALEEEKEYA